jgi:hypothetical protein
MADQPSPALKEIFNADRLKHIATEMTGQRVPARGTAVEL